MLKKYLLLIWVCIFFLNACSMLSPVKTEMTRHILNVHPQPTTKKMQRARNTLMVMVPEVKPLYASTDMLYSTSRFKIAAFAKNNWAEPPAQMLQPLIIQAMQNTHYFTAVIPINTLGGYDYILSTQLLEFKQIFFNRGSLFRITLRAQIIKGRTAKVLAAKEFTVEQPAPMNSPLGGVIAANCATEKLLNQLAAWYLQQNIYPSHRFHPISKYSTR